MANATAPGPAYIAICHDGRRLPALGTGPNSRVPVEAFRLTTLDSVTLYPLRPPAPAGRRPHAMRTLAAAAGLPLLLMPGPALATLAPGAPPSDDPTGDVSVQSVPRSVTPPSLPEGRDMEASDATAAPYMPSVEEAPGPAAPAAPAAPATSRIDAAWEGVVGYDVVIQLSDGTLLEGRVSAVQADTFTLIDFAAGGVVVVKEKSKVVSLRVRPPAANRAPSNAGSGLIIGGAVLTAIGAPILIIGVSCLLVLPSSPSYGLPVLLVGTTATTAGVALLAGGARRRRLARARTNHNISLVPSTGRTRQGTWAGGLRLSF